MDFFGLSRPKPLTLTKKPTVPILQEENFAASIIGLEMEIEVERFTLEDVQTLIKLYSRAVEYYVAAQSNYCIYFQNKIKQLLLRPSVMAMIENKEQPHEEPTTSNINKNNSNPNSKTLNNTDRTTIPIDMTLKKQGMQLTKNLIVAHQEKDLNRLMKNFKVAEEVKNETFNKALHNQMTELGRRVKRRQSLSRVRSTNRSKDVCTYDLKTADISNLDRLSSNRGNQSNQEYGIKHKDNKDIIGELFLQVDDSLGSDKVIEYGEKNVFSEH